MWKTIRDWWANLVWAEAYHLARTLRADRADIRVLVLCQFTEHGPAAILSKMEAREILSLRQLVGRDWFDTQVLMADEGHEVSDPFRTLV
jgi:hypothetical protein